MKKLFVGVLVLISILLTACENSKDEEKWERAGGKNYYRDDYKKAIVEDVMTDEDAFKEYAKIILPLNQKIVGHLSIIGELASKTSSNPELFFDSQYIEEFEYEHDEFYYTIQDIKRVNIPDNPKVKEVHDVYLKALNEYEFTAINAPIALKNMDVNLMKQCLFTSERGGDYFREATTLLNEVDVSY